MSKNPYKLNLASLGLCAFALILCAAVYGLSSYLDAHRVATPENYSDSDLEVQGKRLKGFALGFEGLLADWYWMQSLQYIGNKVINSTDEVINIDDMRSMNPRLLYPYLDNATDLDPHFITAYSYGAVVLPAIDPAKAIALTEKGIANNPDEWRLYQYLGYIYWRTKDYKKAAEVYERGSHIAGVPPFMRMMAAVMLGEGGSRDTARKMYEQMAADPGDEQTRKTAEIRLRQLDAFDQIDAINGALKTAGCPRDLKSIMPALAKTGMEFLVNDKGELADPTGVPYAYNAAECKVSLGNGSQIPREM
jgi:tetratricopeptide (TPR) repeat protein